MAQKSGASGQLAQELLAAFLKLPWKVQVAVGLLVLIAGISIYALLHHKQESPTPADVPGGAKTVVFCLWNMENLFDDKDDKRRPPDEDYDQWFINKPEDRKAKYDKLASWLLKQNDGRGPDVIVGNEIESPRAAEMLQETLNAGLPAGATKYEHVAMKELDAGRHIAPCVISRYPLSGAKLLGKRQRILEVHVTVNGHDMTVVASHWTSQLSDHGTGPEGHGRDGYAQVIYAEYTEAVKTNPKVDFLVCGDFNDTPDSEPVAKTLHVVGDATLVTTDANPPRLYGVLSSKSPDDFGTHYYNKPLIYDHIALSPGMLDMVGWGYAYDSVEVPTQGLIRSGARTRRPWRFGNAKDDALGRGYSDHFPVLVTLKVAP